MRTQPAAAGTGRPPSRRLRPTARSVPPRDRPALGRPALGRPALGLRSLAGALLALLTLAGCAFGPPNDSQSGTPPKLPSPSSSPTDDSGGGATVQVIAKHLAVPWGIAYLPDHSGLITERDKRQIVELGIDGGKPKPVQTITQAVPGGEGGLLGIAVSPHYATDKTVFIYYSTHSDNRIAKLTLGGTPTPIVTGIPHASHEDGGALAFGPDGYLYAGTGDASSPDSAQSTSSLGGKILRMTTSGKPAPGNPAGSLVYASGFRNVQGLAWDEQKRLYATDMGQDKFDEINLVKAGANYGWPQTEGTGHDSRYTDPLETFTPSEGSCSGTAISGTILVTSCLTGERLWMVQLDGKGATLGAPQAALNGTYGRLRSAVRAPDGTLWVSTSNRDGRGHPIADDDRILRIVISGGDSVDKS